MVWGNNDDKLFETNISRTKRPYEHRLQINSQTTYFLPYPANDNNIKSPNMQVNLFKIFAITTALSTVQAAPVETTEGSVTREQIDNNHINKAVVDDAVRAVLMFPKPPYHTLHHLSED